MSVRWLAWLVALAIVVGGGGPAAARPHFPWVLAGTFIELALFSLYLPVLKQGLRRPMVRTRADRVIDHGLFGTAYCFAAAALALAFSGGFASPTTWPSGSAKSAS